MIIGQGPASTASVHSGHPATAAAGARSTAPTDSPGERIRSHSNLRGGYPGDPDPGATVRGDADTDPKVLTRLPGRTVPRWHPGFTPAALSAGNSAIWASVPAELHGLREAVACCCDHGGCSGAVNSADHHIARIVHASVDPRVGDRACQQPDRHGQLWQMPANGVGESERCRSVPGRERGGFRHHYLASSGQGSPGPHWPPPPGERLDDEVHGR
jgi:hypothetical protein